MLVEKDCHVKKNANICSLIHEQSMGWWEECIYCEEKTDLSFSKIFAFKVLTTSTVLVQVNNG